MPPSGCDCSANEVAPPACENDVTKLLNELLDQGPIRLVVEDVQP